MSPWRWYPITKEMRSAFDLRVKMVRLAQEKGISEGARVFGTTRVTVRKWVRRYEALGLSGLKPLSRRPHRSPHRISEALERRILQLRDRFFTFGAAHLKAQFDLPCSPFAIGRVLRQNGRVKPRRKRYQRARDLRALKATLLPLGRLQVDVKELKDIPEFYPAQRRLLLPPYQYSARDLRTGAAFLAYAQELSLTNSLAFLRVLGSHLSALGVPLKGVTLQTDNGSEFIGSAKAKRPSAFTRRVEALGMTHRLIPPGAKTHQSDVEAFHGLVEREFYRVEGFDSPEAFLGKAQAYQLHFNLQRKNSYKGGKSPLEILQSASPLDPKVLAFPVLVLDYVQVRPGYDLPYEIMIKKRSP